MGFDLTYNQAIRLLGLDAPEVRGSEKLDGYVSRDYLRALISDSDVTVLVPKKERGKFGRVLGVIIKDGANINNLMIEEGYAEIY